MSALPLVIDWLQTKYIARHPEKFSEGNVYLGPRPTKQAVDRYFAIAMIVMVLIGAMLALTGCYFDLRGPMFWTYVLPGLWFGAWGLFEIVVVVHNYTAGVRL